MKNLKSIIITLITLSFFITTSHAFAVDTATGEKGVITNLHATHKDHIVTLTWDWNVTDNYTIERNGEILEDYHWGSGEFQDYKTVQDDITYTYTIWANGSNDKKSVTITIEKDTTPPPNLIFDNSPKIDNHFIQFGWRPAAFTPDLAAVDIYMDGRLLTTQEVYPTNSYSFATDTMLEADTTYLFTICPKDKSGNVVPFVDCSQKAIKTSNEKTPPREIKSGNITHVLKNHRFDPVLRKDVWEHYLRIAWYGPEDEDFIGVYLTLPNGLKKYVEGKRYERFYEYEVESIYKEQSIFVQTVDWNGNVSKGKTLVWDNPNPPGPVTNVKIKETNGIVTISFTPPVDHDYKYTKIRLPNKTDVLLNKGTNTYSYKGSLVVGQSYNFVFRTADLKYNESAPMLITNKPKATTVNKYYYTKVATTLRTLSDGKGKVVKSIPKGAKIYVMSSGYGVKHNFVYVKYAGKYTGYLPKTAVKF